jgi:ethanolamine utilization microcompartment shell protein EutL
VSEEFNRIPVIILSGWINAPQPLPGNVVAILAKPVEPSEVMDAVDVALGHKEP